MAPIGQLALAAAADNNNNNNKAAQRDKGAPAAARPIAAYSGHALQCASPAKLGPPRCPVCSARLSSALISIQARPAEAPLAPWRSNNTCHSTPTAAHLTSEAGFTNCASNPPPNHQDKIDSSFARSRSSSGSSSAQTESCAPSQQLPGECIRCLCFLDLAQAADFGAQTGSASIQSAGQASSGNKSLAPTGECYYYWLPCSTSGEESAGLARKLRPSLPSPLAQQYS